MASSKHFNLSDIASNYSEITPELAEKIREDFSDAAEQLIYEFSVISDERAVELDRISSLQIPPSHRFELYSYARRIAALENEVNQQQKDLTALNKYVQSMDAKEYAKYKAFLTMLKLSDDET